MNINICFSSDDNYAQHMGIAIASILNHSEKDDIYNFYILDGGISYGNKQKIHLLNNISKFNIKYIQINTDDFKNCPMTNYVSYITQSTYYRFSIPKLLNNVEKVLYLDCDIIVNSDIKELFNYDIEDYYLGAIPEVFNDSHKKRLDYKDHHYYCNAGVLLINNKKWIEDKIEDKLFEYIQNPSHQIVYQDQDIINEVLKYKIKYLPLEWNLQHDTINCSDSYPYHNEEREYAIRSPKLVHYTNPKKPWKKDCDNKYQYLYYQNAKNTPWKNLYYRYYTKKICKKFIQNFYNKSKVEIPAEGLGKYVKIKYTILGIKLTIKKKKKIEEIIRTLNDHEHARCEYLANRIENVICQLNNQNEYTDVIVNRIQNTIYEQTKLLLEKQLGKSLSVYSLHQKVFSKYKNINKGKDVVLVATGPTLKYYNPITNAVHVGVNMAYKCKLKFDYMFFQDMYSRTKEDIRDFIEYGEDKTIKFIGILNEKMSPKSIIPESYISGENVYRYYVEDPTLLKSFTYDISTSILGDSYSVVFPAMQFILYTQPSKIYLVGCDCSNSGYFDGSAQGVTFTKENIEGWHKLKDFASIYYPDTEIISINPVGLKGLFKDMYTRKDVNEKR